MGAQQTRNSLTLQACQALSPYTQQDIKILEWRSNLQFTEFIPRVTFQQQQKKKTRILIGQCQNNQEIPLKVQHQKFVGNLTILTGKLCFEEALYVLKSLLCGHQTILAYFGKTLVSSDCCFLTKSGEVKAWINEDYRRNTFACEVSDEDISSLDDRKMFLRPQKWIDHSRSSSSQANIIEAILFEVAQLTYQEREFNSFLHNLDSFISGNILKNFNFDRVKKFVNKYIYQKKIFVKSSLLEAIERLYYESMVEKEVLSKSAVYGQSPVERRNFKMSMIREEKQPVSFEEPLLLMRTLTPGKKSLLQESLKTKNSEFFDSTAQTNRSSKLVNSNAQMKQKDGIMFGSYCLSQIQGNQFYDVVQTRLNDNRNHISPQFSMNYCTETAKMPFSQQKMQRSLRHSRKSSFLSSKSSIKNNKTVDFKMQESDLNVIYERKQTDAEEKKIDATNRVKPEYMKTSIMNNRENYQPVEHSFSKTHNIHTFKTKTFEDNKASDISISINGQNFDHKTNGKLFKSHCGNHEKEEKISFEVIGSTKTSSEKQSFNLKKEQSIHNFFTMKTITKLISSNQNISEQQQSEGDFPSNQNISSYSGILASMGRSAMIMEVPDVRKSQFQTSKKQQAMFMTNQGFPYKAGGVKSYNLLLK